MVSISLGHSRAQARLPRLQLPMSAIAPLLCLGPPQPVARNASGRLGGPARSSPSRPCTVYMYRDRMERLAIGMLCMMGTARLSTAAVLRMPPHRRTKFESERRGCKCPAWEGAVGEAGTFERSTMPHCVAGCSEMV